MVQVVLIGLVDRRGRVLLQERDEHAPVHPEKWSLVGGAVEAGESTLEAARRELLEETGIACNDLSSLGVHTLACDVHGQDDFAVFTAASEVTDGEVQCFEGRQMVFVDPAELADLDLADPTAVLLPRVLAAHAASEASPAIRQGKGL